jgi:hypothetical protein
MTHKIDSTGKAAVATDHYWIPIDANTPSGVTMWLINKASGVGQKGRHNPADKFFDHWFPLPIFTKDEI